MLWAADTDEPLRGHCHGGVHGDGEADLGQGEDEGDEVGEDVEAILVRETGDGEYEAGEDDADGVRDEQGGDQGLEDWLEVKIFVL